MQLVDANVMIKAIYNVTKGSMKQQTLPMRQKGRHSDCFVYVLHGSTGYDFGQYHFTVHPGDILYLARDSRYAMRVADDYRFIYVDFDFDNPGVTLDSTVFSMQAYENVERNFRRMERRWIPGNFLCSLQCCTDLHEIYALLLESQSKRYVSSDKEQQMKLSEIYMTRHFADPALNVAELAKQATLSEVHFRRLFKRIYRVSPLQFITFLRIRRAKDLLLDQNLTISQIAEDVGYASVYYFSRLFKQETGLAPSEYRWRAP